MEQEWDHAMKAATDKYQEAEWQAFIEEQETRAREWHNQMRDERTPV
jgi:hypothetical protein